MTAIPDVIAVPGLDAPTLESPAHRRDWLRELSRDELLDRLVKMTKSLIVLAPETVTFLSDLTGLPPGEIGASPYALRAVALAGTDGAHVYHHELRRHIPWPSELVGAEETHEEAHGEWVLGTLKAGKYQSFCQDDPLSPLNPGHMSKWGPHELLHRAFRFYWSERMSPWELYLGAKLNELVPVVHWYGLDEICRLDRIGFEREAEQERPNARLEDARWLHLEGDQLEEWVDASCDHLIASLDHFENELDAIQEEIRSGRVQRVPHPVLDSSSDALAYVSGHFTRLNSKGYHKVFKGLLTPERDYFTTVPEYLDFVESRFDQLLTGEIRIERQRSEGRKRAREIRDLYSRAVLMGGSTFWMVENSIKSAKSVVDALWTGDGDQSSELIQRLLDDLPPDGSAVLCQTGTATPLAEPNPGAIG
ncbi:MAG: hypothetical protein KC561_18125, partial [Myxococcales bacterium]|nr:hypothetical protein [Myxococcales bacterium]